VSTPMRRICSPCCACAANGHAAAPRNELTPVQLIELHPVPHLVGPRTPSYRLGGW
jgi:hypothetical protein